MSQEKENRQHENAQSVQEGQQPHKRRVRYKGRYPKKYEEKYNMKLSIVTVCYNAEQCIDRTIKSVLNQTCPVYEYIIIDGGSKDKTYNRVCSYEKSFAEKGILFKHISERDKGISDAFNKGIKMASGTLIGLINADDELLPETSEILKNECKKIDADIYYGNCYWVDSERNLEYVSKPKHDLSKLLYNMVLIHPSTFVKKKAYEECGLFDVTYKYCMDKELLYRMYKAGKKFDYIDRCLTKFKAGGVSDTHSKAVFKEGSRMALSYGESQIKVKSIEIIKTVRNQMVNMIKETRVYRVLKGI